MATSLPAPKKTTKFPTKELHFDTSNPRFTEDHNLGKATDANVIEFLLSRADLTELVQSIAANGYIDIEPLVVMEVKKRAVVLEGNRRLAAIGGVLPLAPDTHQVLVMDESDDVLGLVFVNRNARILVLQRDA